MTLDEQYAGRSVEVERGQMLVVRLKENPTTGYRWTIESADGLDLKEDHIHAATVPGAAAVREFTFLATRPGNQELRLKNRREWEGDRSVIDRFAVQIRVK